ncbi:MAG: hypothetical protein NZ874_04735 [Fimbriimonadales bacterium]|nr:hypothetical protein [Fimbriimonadales bacterium]
MAVSTLDQLKQVLSGVLPPAEVERAAQALASALEGAIQAEVERRVALLEARNQQAYQQLDAKLQAALELAQESLRIATENVRAIEALRNVVEQHSVQIAENTRAIEQLRVIVEQHSVQIAENTRAIEQLRAVVEAQSNRLAQVEAIVAENTRAIEQLRVAVSQLVQAEQRLTRRTDDLARQLGGLAMTVGYMLENAAYPALPELLMRDYQIRVLTELKRDLVEDAQGNEYEVNIFGEAERAGERLIIVGESKVQLSKPDIDRFLRRKLKPLQRIFAGQELFPVIVAHMITTKKVLSYAQEKGIAIYLSYQFKRSSSPFG